MNTTVWLITFTLDGKKRQVVQTHNAVADYPNATSEAIDCSAVAELIAADKEYDERRALLAQAVRLMERDGAIRAGDVEAAVYHEARAGDRRAAALAACGVKP